MKWNWFTPQGGEVIMYLGFSSCCWGCCRLLSVRVVAGEGGAHRCWCRGSPGAASWGGSGRAHCCCLLAHWVRRRAAVLAGPGVRAPHSPGAPNTLLTGLRNKMGHIWHRTWRVLFLRTRSRDPPEGCRGSGNAAGGPYWSASWGGPYSWWIWGAWGTPYSPWGAP